MDEFFLRQLVDVRSAIEAKVVQFVAANPDANLDAVRELLGRPDAELQDSELADRSLDLRF